MKIRDSRHAADIIGAIGTECLGARLDAVLRQRVEFDMSCLYLFQFNVAPLLVHNGYNDLVPSPTLSAYARGGYLLDPFYVACMNDHPGGLWRMTDLAPDSFFSSGFAISADSHPCVSSIHGTRIEEIGFIVPLKPRVALVYSLMRSLERGAFEVGEMRSLEAWAPILSAALESHFHLRLESYCRSSRQREELIEDAFLDILPGQLTETQRFVTKFILQGHSNGAIAEQMKISEGTVRVHKHNIYQKLAISSQSELFRLFIDYLARSA
ncbi:LuxR C-terminal-related transcriptional regulator [Halomonas salifodinae]|uniref:LuxR C-terminal-related transcriptional regulator n=1 Tax=Halomonas salifodinae TaxID=438745 RepID=A0ABW2EZ36_9GAMM